MEQPSISEAIVHLFNGKYLNKGELFPLQIMEGKLVLKITVQGIEALKHGNAQTYGVVDINTLFRFKVSQKAQATIKVNSNEAKQLFKDNISF